LDGFKEKIQVGGNMSNINDSNEIFSGRRVHPRIVCRDCIWAHGPAPFVDDPEKSNCLKYPCNGARGDKPLSVYYDGEDCEFRMTEGEKKAAEARLRERRQRQAGDWK